MRTIRISDEVWSEIAKQGKFGETPDGVLKRVFKIDKSSPIPQPANQVYVYKTRMRQATRTMSSKVTNGYLVVEFYKGPSNKWAISKGDDINKIRQVRKEACEFAKNNGATFGQIMAVKKALTNAGIYISR